MTKEYVRIDGELYKKVNTVIERETPSYNINRHTYTDDAHLTDALTPASEEFDINKCDNIEVLNTQLDHHIERIKEYVDECVEIRKRIKELQG